MATPTREEFIKQAIAAIYVEVESEFAQYQSGEMNEVDRHDFELIADALQDVWNKAVEAAAQQADSQAEFCASIAKGHEANKNDLEAREWWDDSERAGELAANIRSLSISTHQHTER